MYPAVFKPTLIDIENARDHRTGSMLERARTSNHGATQKPDNPFKGVRNIVSNINRNQWSCRLAVLTIMLKK